MTEISFTSLAVVAATGFVAPLVLGFLPKLRLPNVVLEIVLGILIGPSVLGWAHADEPVQIMSLIGLSFLLLIAGLEVDYERFSGRLLEVTGLAPGGSVDVLPSATVSHPRSLSALAPKRWHFRALLDVDHSFAYGGAGEGDLESEDVVVESYDPAASPVVALILGKRLPARVPEAETDRIRLFPSGR